MRFWEVPYFNVKPFDHGRSHASREHRETAPVLGRSILECCTILHNVFYKSSKLLCSIFFCIDIFPRSFRTKDIKLFKSREFKWVSFYFSSVVLLILSGFSFYIFYISFLYNFFFSSFSFSQQCWQVFMGSGFLLNWTTEITLFKLNRDNGNKQLFCALLESLWLPLRSDICCFWEQMKFIIW